jgi:hypothetical protein
MKNDYKSYSEKLRDPRWQKKRLEILERDLWICQRCCDTETTLHVHHCYYNNTLEPWEYPNESLVTLCENCHKTEKDEFQLVINMLSSGLSMIGVTSSDIDEMVYQIPFWKFNHLKHVVFSAIDHVMRNPKLQQIVIDSYFKYLSEKNKENVKTKKSNS